MTECLIGLAIQPLKNKIPFNFFRKQIIEEMEAELTELLVINSKTDFLEVTDEADVDEAIPIYL